MPSRLHAASALVIGAGTPSDGLGNGAAIAARLAEHGAWVTVVDKDGAAAERTRELIEQAGGRCDTFVADASSEPELRAAVEATVKTRGTVDVLVNNVGVVTLGGPEDLDVAAWDRAFAINVRTAFLACKHVLPVMRARRRGSIVQVSSLASVRWGGTAFCAYAASKAALNALGQSIALQYAAHGIRCNNILLGLIDTPLVRHQLGTTDPAGIEHLLQARHAMSPTGAMGSPWDAADAALFLASDESRYVNGVDLLVDGGLHGQVLRAERPH